MEDMTKAQVAALALDLIDHLDYTGWGDSWEREVSERLRDRVAQITPLLKAYAES